MTSAGPPPSRFETLHALQGLRAIAALLVVCDHGIATMILKANASNGLEDYAYFLGNFGVHIFFLISGFVMVLNHFQDFNRQGAPARFMLKRIGRIVPLYWLTTVIYYVKSMFTGNTATISALTLSLLFIPHQETGAIFGRPVYSLGWTLEYEMAFYAVFAIALYFRLWIGVGIIAGVFFGLVMLVASGALGHDTICSYFGDMIVLYFVGGVAIGLARCRLGGVIPGFRLAAIIASGFVAASCGVAFFLGPDPRPREAIGTICCFGAVAVCGLAAEGRSRAASKEVSKMLGDATYSIYLTHPFVLGPAGRIVARFFPHFSPVAFVFVNLVLAGLVGVLTYKYVEKPMVATWSSFLNRCSRLLAPVRE